MKSYELHTYKDGKWKIDSVFDDEETAMHEARRAQTANRYNTIRLIEEDYDQVKNSTTTRTLFRADGGNSPAEPRPQVYKPGLRPAQETGQPATESAAWQTKRPAAQAPAKARKVVLPLILLILLGAALMVGLEIMQHGV